MTQIITLLSLITLLTPVHGTSDSRTPFIPRKSVRSQEAIEKSQTPKRTFIPRKKVDPQPETPKRVFIPRKKVTLKKVFIPRKKVTVQKKPIVQDIQKELPKRTFIPRKRVAQTPRYNSLSAVTRGGREKVKKPRVKKVKAPKPKRVRKPKVKKTKKKKVQKPRIKKAKARSFDTILLRKTTSSRRQGYGGLSQDDSKKKQKRTHKPKVTKPKKKKTKAPKKVFIPRKKVTPKKAFIPRKKVTVQKKPVVQDIKKELPKRTFIPRKRVVTQPKPLTRTQDSKEPTKEVFVPRKSVRPVKKVAAQKQKEAPKAKPKKAKKTRIKKTKTPKPKRVSKPKVKKPKKKKVQKPRVKKTKARSFDTILLRKTTQDDSKKKPRIKKVKTPKPKRVSKPKPKKVFIPRKKVTPKKAFIPRKKVIIQKKPVIQDIQKELPKRTFIPRKRVAPQSKPKVQKPRIKKTKTPKPKRVRKPKVKKPKKKKIRKPRIKKIKTPKIKKPRVKKAKTKKPAAKKFLDTSFVPRKSVRSQEVIEKSQAPKRTFIPRKKITPQPEKPKRVFIPRKKVIVQEKPAIQDIQEELPKRTFIPRKRIAPQPKPKVKKPRVKKVKAPKPKRVRKPKVKKTKTKKKFIPRKKIVQKPQKPKRVFIPRKKVTPQKKKPVVQDIKKALPKRVFIPRKRIINKSLALDSEKQTKEIFVPRKSVRPAKKVAAQKQKEAPKAKPKKTKKPRIKKVKTPKPKRVRKSRPFDTNARKLAFTSSRRQGYGGLSQDDSKKKPKKKKVQKPRVKKTKAPKPKRVRKPKVKKPRIKKVKTPKPKRVRKPRKPKAQPKKVIKPPTERSARRKHIAVAFAALTAAQIKAREDAREYERAKLAKENRIIRTQVLSQDIEPYTFLANLDSRSFFGDNVELLNSNNQFDTYSFIQYTFDTGVYVLPHTHYQDNESLEFKAIARIKGNAGNVGRYTQTDRVGTKIGWTITESDHSHRIDRMLFWMRDLWLKYYFNTERTTYFTAGYFPFSIGHGIALGDGHLVGQPLPGQYTPNDIDQFRPGLLLGGTLRDNQFAYNLYFGTIVTRSDTYNSTAAFSNAQNLEKKGKIYRGSWKNNYVFAGQLTCQPHTSERTTCLVHPYLVFNYDNQQAVDFDNDAESKLLTVGTFVEYEHGPLSATFEAAHNFGTQDVKKWDRNVFHMGAKPYHSHLLYLPAGTATTQAAYNALSTAADQWAPYTAMTTPHNFSRNYANGEIFDEPFTSGKITHKLRNSYSRFRKAYKNNYEGWFFVADAAYQFRDWRLGMTLGMLSGDNPPNDSEDYLMASRLTSGLTYKDSNKDYKGFVGVQEMFRGKAVKPCFIHEAQKLNRPLSAYSNMTKPMLTNLFFFGTGIQYESLLRTKQLMVEANALVYFQHKQMKKGTNLPYSEIESITFTTARQNDRNKLLDTHLGLEFNASAHYKVTHDLDFYAKAAIFIPGDHYKDAAGKYIPIKNQINFAGADISGVKDIAEVYNITLGRDAALFASVGLTYSFDSLILKKKQEFYKPKSFRIERNKS